MRSFKKDLVRSAALSLLIVGIQGALVSCGGNTSGEGDSGDGTAFNDTDQAAGSINLTVTEDHINVADTSGFRVRVEDAQGVGVEGVQIACDTEAGLALLEPTSGFELTDSTGEISGRVGCATPGSYQIGCRLPIGGTKRSLKTVICEGSVPSGFTGFAGSGGGSLGVPSGSGGAIPPAGSGSVQLTGIAFTENGTDNSLSLDVVQGSCGAKDQNGDGDTTDPGDIDFEPFSDTFAKIAVTNNTSETINFSSFSYEVAGADGSGTFFGSTELAFSQGGSVAANSSTSLTALFLKAANGGKRFTGSSASISASLGFRNVTFTLFGTTSSGASIQVQGTVGASFGNFDTCTN